jgi:hypothetical protein
MQLRRANAIDQRRRSFPLELAAVAVRAPFLRTHLRTHGGRAADAGLQPLQACLGPTGEARRGWNRETGYLVKQLRVGRTLV